MRTMKDSSKAVDSGETFFLEVSPAVLRLESVAAVGPLGATAD